MAICFLGIDWFNMVCLRYSTIDDHKILTKGDVQGISASSMPDLGSTLPLYVISYYIGQYFYGIPLPLNSQGMENGTTAFLYASDCSSFEMAWLVATGVKSVQVNSMKSWRGMAWYVINIMEFVLNITFKSLI